MKNLFPGNSSDAAKSIFPVKLDNFGAASSYHGDELQRTHYLLQHVNGI